MFCPKLFLFCFLVDNASPESPRCERRLVCGSDGQVYETSCDFERALRLDQSLGARPLHECLGMLYVLMPKEHSRAHKHFTKLKIASFVRTILARGVQKGHNIKSLKTNAVLKVLRDILSLQGADDTANLMTLCPRGRGCPDTIYILPEEHFIPQKNLKSVVLPTRRLSLLQYLPSREFFATIIQGIFTKVVESTAPTIRGLVEFIVVQIQEFIINILESFVPNQQESDPHNPNGSDDNNYNDDNGNQDNDDNYHDTVNNNHNYDKNNHNNNHKNGNNNNYNYDKNNHKSGNNNNYNYDNNNINYDNHNHHNNINNQYNNYYNYN